MIFLGIFSSKEKFPTRIAWRTFISAKRSGDQYNFVDLSIFVGEGKREGKLRKCNFDFTGEIITSIGIEFGCLWTQVRLS
jgi:hypothetical protein